MTSPSPTKTKPEDECLRPDAAAIGSDELGQECEEEERRLRIEDVHDRAAHDCPPQRFRLALDPSLRIAIRELPDAEIDQVRGACVLDGAEGQRRGDDQGRQSRRGRGDVHERAEMDAGDRRQPDAASLLGALEDDEEDGRPRDQQQRQSRQAEKPHGGRVRKDHGYHSGPCAGTTSRLSAAR